MKTSRFDSSGNWLKRQLLKALRTPIGVTWKNSVRDALGKFLFEQTRRSILPVIMEANQNGRRRKRSASKTNNNSTDKPVAD